MNIKNPEKVLGESIIGRDGHLWQICEVSKLWDSYDEPYIQFNLLAVVDISNTLMRNKQNKAELRIYESRRERIYQLICNTDCNTEVLHGYVEDINTKDKFISKLKSML